MASLTPSSHFFQSGVNKKKYVHNKKSISPLVELQPSLLKLCQSLVRVCRQVFVKRELDERVGESISYKGSH